MYSLLYSLECLRLPPLVLALPGGVVAEAALGGGGGLHHAGHAPVHTLHPRPDPLPVWNIGIS